MRKRLVWNFEINSAHAVDWQEFTATPADEARWEARFFWPEDAVIVLNALPEAFLNLSHYHIKHRSDTYFVLPNENHNIKLRRDRLLYKPLLNRSAHALAYGKKLPLEELAPEARLPGILDQTAEELLAKIHAQGLKIHVDKEALIYKIPSTPTLKIELAKLSITSQTYFSLSIEAYKAVWVESLAKRILPNETPSDYVSFLKEHFS